MWQTYLYNYIFFLILVNMFKEKKILEKKYLANNMYDLNIWKLNNSDFTNYTLLKESNSWMIFMYF